MRKQKNMISFFLIMSLLLTACGGAGSAPAQTDQAEAEADAGESEKVFIPAIPDEPYEAVDYSLYPSPEGGYVGDVMPFVTDEGELELYYLYDTDASSRITHSIDGAHIGVFANGCGASFENITMKLPKLIHSYIYKEKAGGDHDPQAFSHSGQMCRQCQILNILQCHAFVA